MVPGHWGRGRRADVKLIILSICCGNGLNRRTDNPDIYKQQSLDIFIAKA